MSRMKAAGIATLAMLALANIASAQGVPTTTVPSVTVTAPPVAKVPNLVQHFSKAVGLGRLARWDSEICPSVRGLPVAFDAFIAARIRQTAVSVGGLAAGPRCRVNIAVLIVPDAQAVTEKLVRRHRDRLQQNTRWPIDRAALAAWVADDHPVRVWQVSETLQTLGGAVNDTDIAGLSAALGGSNVFSNSALPVPAFDNVTPSRLKPSGDQAFRRVVVVVDANRIAGMTAGQVSAYLAMVTLAEVRPNADLGGVDTIMNLFEDQKDGRAPASDLTFWDRAYLQGLYRTNAQVNGAMQVSAISDHIRTDILRRKVLPLAATATVAPSSAAP